MPASDEHLAKTRLVAGILDVKNLYRLARHSCASDRAFALPDRCAAQRGEHFGIGVLGGTQMKFGRVRVVLIDRPAVETRDLYRPRDDRFEYGIEVQRRANGPPDLF